MADSWPEKSGEMRDGDKEDKESQKDRARSRDRRKEDRDALEKEKSKDRVREKDSDKDRHRDKERDRAREKDRRYHEKESERDKELERDGGRGRHKERGKDKTRDADREKDKYRERTKDREKEKEKDREKQRERERDYDRVRSKDTSEKEKGRHRVKEHDRQKSRDVDGNGGKLQNEDHNRNFDVGKDEMSRFNGKDGDDGHSPEQDKALAYDAGMPLMKGVPVGPGSQPSASELEERILKMKEERLKKKTEGASEVLDWVNKSRKIEEKKKAQKAKVVQISNFFEDEIDQEDDDSEIPTQQSTAKELGGAKVLHGLDKVLEGGSVILTLRDQSILSGDDINQEVDMLENVEIGEQKRRDDAYKAAKKKTGIYDQIDELGFEKKMLPQYDDPMEEESVALDETGRFSGDAANKLEELRKRVLGVATKSHAEDLNSSGRVLTDYYTQEEMLQFKKPKKKKSLRKKEKLDINALEAEAISSGLGIGDLGSRNDKTRQQLKEENERAETEKRDKAYQTAYAKAEEASKALRPVTAKAEEDDDATFDDDDDEELRKSLERARKLALRTQDASKSAPETIAFLSTLNANNSAVDNNSHTSASGDLQENKIVFSEMEEFVWGLQLDEDARKPGDEDVFMAEDVIPNSPDKTSITEDGGWSEVKETEEKETNVKEEEIVPDGTIHEAAVGKGLSGALKRLKDHGSLKETIEWGGRSMDKKKSKLAGILDEEGPKEIHIERTDEYGRILTPKEAFRLISHKFHGKGPGKLKQEKRMRQYQEELKIKQMKNSDTPSQSVERMREAQEKLKTPYLVLSGNVKPGQTSDPRSGFATVEKDFPGSLTPMLGDRKVEHFLGIKRKPESSGDPALQKKPRS